MKTLLKTLWVIYALLFLIITIAAGFSAAVICALYTFEIPLVLICFSIVYLRD